MNIDVAARIIIALRHRNSAARNDAREKIFRNLARDHRLAIASTRGRRLL